jgi:predicted AAA+ superfamily ATPase
MQRDEISVIINDQQEVRKANKSKPVTRLVAMQPYLNSPEVCVISGIRRCGKSTLLRQIAESLSASHNVFLLELDDPRLEKFEGNDFQVAYELWRQQTPQLHERTLFLWDEVQKESKWERWADHFSKRSLHKIIITGSNSKLLSYELSTYLTGRHFGFELWPLSFREIVAYRTSTDPSTIKPTTEQTILLRTLWGEYFSSGGFPRAFLDSSTHLLPQYLQDILEKDIIARYGTRLSSTLKDLARILCTDNTKLINRSKLTRHLGIKDQNTVRKYCDYLTECYVFFELKCFSFSLRKQQRSLSKYYCADPVLARSNSFTLSRNEGSFLENIVAVELRRRGFELYYWCSEEGGCEVDFIIRKPGNDAIAIQVALTIDAPETRERELRGLIAAHQELKISKLVLITLAHAEEVTVGGAKIEIKSFLYWSLLDDTLED